VPGIARTRAARARVASGEPIGGPARLRAHLQQRPALRLLADQRAQHSPPLGDVAAAGKFGR